MESEEEHSELIEGLCLLVILDIVELDHMAVGGVHTHQQQNGVLKSLLGEASTDIVVEHEVGQNLDVEYHLLVVEGLSNA